ncbi:MAG: coenzyme F420-0:L-glutamate ligase [Thaumarchaeota archaeon]|nr:coenzyme F420-0:L-glutamate ligase [Nitrososphaerota archaeon]
MQIIPIQIQKEIEPSDDVVDLISSHSLYHGDVIVVAQKAVSKQEGRIISLQSVKPSNLAEGIASQYGKDSRIVELILSESKRIVRMRDGIIIVKTHHGYVCANAGVDESNVKEGYATLLPLNPDDSARRIRHDIMDKTKKNISVIISDTFGRPFRLGQTDCAIGISGMSPILDYAGVQDSFGRVLRVTAIAVADEIASAAELVMKKTDRCPAAIIRGCKFDVCDVPAISLCRPQDEDLFG